MKRIFLIAAYGLVRVFFLLMMLYGGFLILRYLRSEAPDSAEDFAQGVGGIAMAFIGLVCAVLMEGYLPTKPTGPKASTQITVKARSILKKVGKLMRIMTKVAVRIGAIAFLLLAVAYTWVSPPNSIPIITVAMDVTAAVGVITAFFLIKFNSLTPCRSKIR